MTAWPHGSIAIAASGLGHVTRGIEAWAADLATALRRRGLPVFRYQGSGQGTHPLDRTIGCWPRDSRSTRLTLNCVPRRLGWRWGLGSPYAIEQTTFAHRLLKQLRQDRIKLLHVQDPLVARTVHRAFERGLLQTQVVLGHGTEEPAEFLRELPCVQHLAPWHLEQTQQRLGVNGGSDTSGRSIPHWRAIGNFVDTDRFQPGTDLAWRQELQIPGEGLVVLCLAAIKRPHKRIDHLLTEFSTALQTRSDLPLWLIVAGANEADTNALVAEGLQRLGHRVRFLVDLPRDRIPSLLRTADLFVLPSLYEMMPIALLEAIASGLPCLTHEHPVLRWMTGPGGRGVDMAAPGELARHIIQMATRFDERRAMGDRAREHATSRFRETVIVDQVLDFYDEILTHSAHEHVA